MERRSPPIAVVTFIGDGMEASGLASVLTGAGLEVTRFRSVERTLLDTFDGRLHAAGLRLEIRKATDLELIVSDGGPAPAVSVVDRVPAVVGDLPAGPLRSRLGPVLDVRALRPTVTATFGYASAVRRNESGKAVVGVSIGARVGAPCAAEVIPYEGYPKAARQMEALLASLGLEARDGDALDLAAADAGIDLRGFVDSPTVALDPSEPALRGFLRVMSNLADTIDANRQGTVDDIDPEFLHDFRIAVRRTRSILSHGKGVLPSQGRDHFRAEFRWLGNVTSPLRDMDVYLIEWPGYVAPLDPASAAALAPLLDHISRRRAAEHVALVGHLDSPRYEGLMTAWRSWLAAPTGADPAPRKARRAIGPVVVARIADAQAQVLMRGRGIGPDTEAEELHELRKDAKRLRYLLECFGGMIPAPVRKPFVQRLKALQDNLGEHQDTEVHTAQLKAMSEELHGSAGVTAETLLAMGRLTEVFERRRKQARAEFAERFANYDTRQTTWALRGLLEAVEDR